MSFEKEGTLKTDKRETAISQNWNTQTEWENYQSKSNIEINSGVLTLSEFSLGVPNSAYVHLDANSISVSDGNTVSTWNNQAGSVDAVSDGAPTFRESSINGSPAVDFDGTVDKFDINTNTVAQPFTSFVVLDLKSTGNYSIISSDNNTVSPKFGTTEWQAYAGSTIIGSTDSTRTLITTVLDGANSLIREDGIQTASGDAGNTDVSVTGIGYRNLNNDQYADVRIGFVELHDGYPTDGIQTREQEIADYWGITL